MTVQSYNGALDFGMIACRRAMPDVQYFAACMLASHQELLAAAVAQQALSQAKAQAHEEAMAPIPVKKRAAVRKTASKSVAKAAPGAAGAKPAAKRKPRAVASA